VLNPLAWICRPQKDSPHRATVGFGGQLVFITIKCVPPGKNQLCQAGVGEGILAAMAYNHKNIVWHCRLCLLMPDHLHASSLFRVNRAWQQPSELEKIHNHKAWIEWQRDFFDHRLRDRHELEEKTFYILMNPVRKGVMRTDGRLDLGVSPGGSSAGIVGINRLW